MDSKKIPYVLTVSGFDSSGCAGLQMDNRAIHAVGAMPLNVPSAWTVQIASGFVSCHLSEAAAIKAAMQSLLADYPIGAIKIGMLGNAANVQAVAAVLRQYSEVFTVLDPVLATSSGHPLLDAAGCEQMNECLMPLVDLVTPNLEESSRVAVQKARAFLIKGGHQAGAVCVDKLQIGSDEPILFRMDRILTQHARGTGCALSAAIAAYVASGKSLTDSCRYSKKLLHQALLRQSEKIYQGSGPAL